MSAGGMLQFAFGLALVLGLIVAAGWFMKRFSIGPSASGLVKVIAGAAVGQRERVVVVEIDDTWLVIGVAPGRVSALHTLPRPQGAHALTETAQLSFAQRFKRALERTHA